MTALAFLLLSIALMAVGAVLGALLPCAPSSTGRSLRSSTSMAPRSLTTSSTSPSMCWLRRTPSGGSDRQGRVHTAARQRLRRGPGHR